ncbi:MAG: class I SAM-dependent methyltransferase, partial [Planctomycetota bacterium]
MDPRRHSFDPARLYARGMRGQVRTALQMWPSLHAHLCDVVRQVAPHRALEVGAGTRPVTAGVPFRVSLDVAPALLAGLGEHRVVGDVRRCPLRPDSFDLAVAADVLTHVPPGERAAVLRTLTHLAPRLLLLVNTRGPGAECVGGESIADTLRVLDEAGLVSQCDEIPFAMPGGEVWRYAVVLG